MLKHKNIKIQFKKKNAVVEKEGGYYFFFNAKTAPITPRIKPTSPITPKVKMLSKENNSTIIAPVVSFPDWYSKTALTMIRTPNTTAIASTIESLCPREFDA